MDVRYKLRKVNSVTHKNVLTRIFFMRKLTLNLKR